MLYRLNSVIYNLITLKTIYWKTLTDIFTKKKRSEIMSRISGKETKPEILVRKLLFANGFRYRKNDKRYPGKPDIVLPKYKTVIFINGCFWHGHKNCKKANLPKTNYEFWKNKIDENIQRDKKIYEQLKVQGWNVLILWQCQLNNQNNIKRTIDKLIKNLKNQRTANKGYT